MNEIITNQDLEARKLADGITIDTTDPNFVSDTLLQSQLAGLTADGVVTAANLAANSDVETFIASLQVNFGELQDVVNIIEEHTNGEVFVDTSDTVLLRHQLQPFTTGRGFVLKDTAGTADDADTTCYYDGTPEYWESSFKSDSFSNQLYGILPAEAESLRENFILNTSVAFAQNNPNSERGVKFRPTHSHFLPGDIWVMCRLLGDPATITPLTTRFRVITDTAGVPTNVGGVVANIDFGPQVFGLGPTVSVDDPSYRFTNEESFFSPANARITAFNLDTTKDYWFLQSDDNAATGPDCIWAAQSTGNVTTCFHTTNMSSDSAGGSGYTISTGQVAPFWAIPRRRSQAFECADPLSIAAVGSGLATTEGNHITSTLSNIPSSVTTKEAIQKYLINQLYFMARPQVSWSTLRISVPNIPILPNDPLMIVDSTLLFSTSGRQAVTATTGSMTYEFGSRGGTGNSIQSSLYLNIVPVGFANHY